MPSPTDDIEVSEIFNSDGHHGTGWELLKHTRPFDDSNIARKPIHTSVEGVLITSIKPQLRQWMNL